MTAFNSITSERDGGVLTVKIRPMRETLTKDPPDDAHRELGLFFDSVRTDPAVRVIVLTGEKDGEFCVPPAAKHYAKTPTRLRTPGGQWSTFTGIVHTIQVMTELETPIVARVNGDALGFGQSLVFASDLIVAREDARISDLHMAMGTVPNGEGDLIGGKVAQAPGDGAGALIPAFMAPPLAKEYLMLSRVRTAAELARDHLINYAVPASQLDQATDKLVAELLERPTYALGWTKRIVNRRVAAHLNVGLDAAAAYEMVTILHGAQAESQ